MSGQSLQATRQLAVETPLGDDVLLLASFSGHESMSRLFSYSLEMLSANHAIAPPDIVGKNVSFRVKLADGSPRWFNGFVSRFSAGSGESGFREYTAEVVPWLWFLTQTTDCRIFQNKSVPQIVEQVFQDLGFMDFDTSEIHGNHPKREYCVQYRETDFNFVSRLIEEEGIFYYFRHEQGKHTLVLADQKGAYKVLPEAKVEHEYTYAGRFVRDRITSWRHQYEFRPGRWAQTDYNFENPGGNLATPANVLLAKEKSVLRLSETDKYEVYDYPGDYLEKEEGKAETRTHMEEDEAPYDVVVGSSTCKTFTPGGKFTVTRHGSESEVGKTYVVTSIQHSAAEPTRYGRSGGVGQDYHNTFTCIPESVTFRPPRISIRPSIQGSQTAVVTGPRGEEIWPDQYGRVKVQFFWDREGRRTEDTSCWIRCAQSSAGKGWGSMFIPRIGQEVIVSYLEGNPDRPIITGLVYNADQMPPYSLPEEKTKSYWKTNSSKGGDGFNEIRFEDKKGHEQVFVHAEKDLDVRVKNVARETICGDRHRSVGGHQRELVEKDKHSHVKGDQREKIEGDLSLQVVGRRDEKVGTVYAADSGQEIVLTAGMKVIIKAGAQLSLIGPGGFVDIGPAGVTIQGMTVNINCGGAPGEGSPCNPKDPEDPAAADDARTGRKSAPDSLA